MSQQRKAHAGQRLLWREELAVWFKQMIAAHGPVTSETTGTARRCVRFKDGTVAMFTPEEDWYSLGPDPRVLGKPSP